VTDFYRQVAQELEETAREVVDLVAPLVRVGQDRQYFQLWAASGFHINPISSGIEVPTFRPNLLLLGAAKCGTTTLYSYLRDIPEICMSMPKEVFFFEAEYELGLDYYRRRYFAHWNGESIVGEARHRNLYLPFIPERIFTMDPDVKLIVCVRNPIDRSYSHWWHWSSRQVECLGFEQAIEEDIERIKLGWTTSTLDDMKLYKLALELGAPGLYCSYIDSGYYYEQIIRYLQHFPKDRLKIILFEDIQQNPYAVIRDLETFIGVHHYTPNRFLGKHENRHLPETSALVRQQISRPLNAALSRTQC